MKGTYNIEKHETWKQCTEIHVETVFTNIILKIIDSSSFSKIIVFLEAAVAEEDHEREVSISFGERPKQTDTPSPLMRFWRPSSSLWRSN